MGANCPGVLLENIKGYHGKKVAVNLHGGWANHAIMMGMPKTTPLKEQFYELKTGKSSGMKGSLPARM
jgi:UbiD family decarboxylase